MIETVEVLSLLSESRSRDTFGNIDFLLRKVVEWTDFDGVILWFPWQDEGQELRVYAAGSFFKKKSLPVFHALSDKSFVGEGIKAQGRWTRAIDIRDPKMDDIERQIVATLELTAVAGIPFRLSGGLDIESSPERSWTSLVTGSLNFYRCGETSSGISKKDLDLLEQCTQVFAHCFTAMVDSVGFRFIEELRKKIRAANSDSGLFDSEMTKAVSTFEDLIRKTIPCMEVCLHFLREDLGGQEVFAPAGIWPWPPDRVQEKSYERGVGFTGRCFDEGKTMVSGDALRLAEQGKAKPPFTRKQAIDGGVSVGLNDTLAPIGVLAIPLIEAQATVGVLRCAAKSGSPYFFAMHEVFFLEQAGTLIADWFGRKMETFRALRAHRGVRALVGYVGQLGSEVAKLSKEGGDSSFFPGFIGNLMDTWLSTLPEGSRICFRELDGNGDFVRSQSRPFERGRKTEETRPGFSWIRYEKAIQGYYDSHGKGGWPASPWISAANTDQLVFPLRGVEDGVCRVMEVIGPRRASFTELDRQIGYVSSMMAGFAGVLAFYVQGEQRARQKEKESKEAEEKAFKLLAHQVRTPLSSSLYALETLTRRAEAPVISPGKIRDSAQDVRQAILRAHRVSQRMRVFSEIADQDRLTKVEIRDVPVFEVARRVREMAADHEKQWGVKRGMTIAVAERNESGSAPLRADLDLLEQAIEILVENAVKYGDSNTEILIELASGNRGRAQLIKVRNSARTTPLRSDEARRIMEFGVRMDRANKRSGWGAGLYLAHVIVKALGGELSVSATSDRDWTTIFTLSIPTGLR